MTIRFELKGKKYKSIPQFENIIDPCSGCYFNTHKNNDCANTPHVCTYENIIYVEDKDEHN
jgi:hypothetical protein